MTTDHADDPPTSLYDFAMQGGKLGPASETPEAPPAREPDYGDQEGVPEHYYVAEYYCGGIPTGDWEPNVKGWDRDEWTREQAVAACVAHRDAVLASAKPTEPPPLPDGWTHQQEHSEEGVAFDNYETRRGSVTVYYDGTVSLRGITVQAKDVHAVLAHHLGLTAPAADVRALEALCERWEDRPAGGSIGHNWKKQCAAELRALLTGKGAPL